MKTKATSFKDIESFKDCLQKHNFKATAQRIAVHQAMVALGHASADMVTQWIRGNSETAVTVASVYNILSQMTGLGIYSYRMSPDNKTWYDVTPGEHFHLYDSVNRRYHDIADEQLVKEIKSVIGKKRFRGYTTESLDVQFVVRPTKRRS